MKKYNDENMKSPKEIKNTKISWHVSHMKLRDRFQLSLYPDIQNIVSLNISFLTRQCERLS